MYPRASGLNMAKPKPHCQSLSLAWTNTLVLKNTLAYYGIHTLKYAMLYSTGPRWQHRKGILNYSKNYQSLYLCLHISVSLSLSLYLCLYISVSISLSLYLCLYISVSISLSLYLCLNISVSVVAQYL
jgi:hypothetical protein